MTSRRDVIFLVFDWVYQKQRGERAARTEEATIYQLYDATYFAMTPLRLGATAMQAALNTPYNPWSNTLPGKMLSAAADVWGGVVERRTKTAWNIMASIETIDTKPFANLVKFSRQRVAGEIAPKVLLAAPMSGHFATLLRGTIEELVREHDVYVTDWIDARDVPLAAGRFDLDDYTAYLIDYLRLLGPDVHAIAVCQPGPALVAAVAIMAEDNDAAQPRSMVLMGAPIDASVSPTAPTELAAEKPLSFFEDQLTTIVPNWYTGGGRHVYPGFLQIGAFLAMNANRHLDAHIDMFNELVRGEESNAHRRRDFYDEYLTVMDIPAEFYVQTVKSVFQDYDLARGTLMWRGRHVNPTLIEKTALLTVEGENDDISAPGQTYAAQNICAAIPEEKRDHLLEPGVGHYGIFTGHHWRERIAPRITAFIRSNA